MIRRRGSKCRSVQEEQRDKESDENQIKRGAKDCRTKTKFPMLACLVLWNWMIILCTITKYLIYLGPVSTWFLHDIEVRWLIVRINNTSSIAFIAIGLINKTHILFLDPTPDTELSN